MSMNLVGRFLSQPRWMGLALILLTGSVAGAQVAYLDHQHLDIRLEYNPEAEGTNRLNLLIRYNATSEVGMDYFVVSNSQVYIVGGAQAQLTIPNNPDYYFLGAPGSPVWILPQSQNLTLPYVGTSAEEIPLGVFDGPLRMELMAVEGPARNFFAWANTGAGLPPVIKYIATNGVVVPEYNALTPLTGSHEHYNWGFSTNGLYRITLRAVGQRLGETTNIIGREVAWAFQILPLRPWESWVSTNWLPATDSSIAGPAADPDGDGIPNALEYALGLDPNVAATNGLPTFSLVTTNGATYGALTFTRVKTATDIDYLPSARSALDAGAWEVLTEVVNIVDHGATETVTVRETTPLSAHAARFFQFRAKLNYP